MKMNSDSFHMPFQAGITSIHNRQYSENFLVADESRLPLQLNFFNRRERECHFNRFRRPSVWIKPKFQIAQSDNDESSRAKSVETFKLLPGSI